MKENPPRKESCRQSQNGNKKGKSGNYFSGRIDFLKAYEKKAQVSVLPAGHLQEHDSESKLKGKPGANRKENKDKGAGMKDKGRIAVLRQAHERRKNDK